MTILHEVDRPASEIDVYITNLEAALNKKLELINGMKGRLTSFKQHLVEEESLSKEFYHQRNEALPISESVLN